MTYFFFFATALIDPGILPRNPIRKRFSLASPNPVTGKPNTFEYVYLNGKRIRMKYCCKSFVVELTEC